MPGKEYAAHKLGVSMYSRRARVRTRVQVVLGHINVAIHNTFVISIKFLCMFIIIIKGKEA